MAKITAYGAREVARLTAVSGRSGAAWLYVLASDGRVLCRPAGPGETYTVRGRIKNPAARTAAALARVAERDGMTIQHPGGTR